MDILYYDTFGAPFAYFFYGKTSFTRGRRGRWRLRRRAIRTTPATANITTLPTRA